MERSFLIRYGLAAEVGRFTADPGASFDRGQTVVVRSHRGTELGEVLVEASPLAAQAHLPHAGAARILRPANPDDLARARAVEAERDDRFEACSRIFQDGLWPIDLIDVEPLLDDRRTVLHYLGPHRLDTAGLLAAFRAACDLDVMLLPVGRDLPDDELDAIAEPEDEHEHEHAGCGAGGCGSGGGCGTGSGGGGGGGCSDCGVKKLLTSRR